MSRFALAVTTAVLTVALFVPRPAAATPGLWPSGGARAPKLDPFRRTAAQAEPAPAEPAAAPAAAAPAPAAPAPAVGSACGADDQCPGGTICENAVCTPVEPPIHALLFRKDGGSTQFLPFYFANRGNPGHRVLAPFYWHFWSPQGKSKVIAPFYWRFEDYISQRVVTVVPPYSHTSEPGAESWAVWPIFYRSTKFGWAAPLLLSFKIAKPDEQRSYGLWALLYFWKRNERTGSSFDLFLPLFASSRSTGAAWTWVFPLNFYWRSGEGDAAAKHLLALPLFYWSSHPKGGTQVAPIGYHSRDDGDRSGAFAWLYWFGRKADGNAYDVVLPIVWSFRSPDSTTTIVPPLLHLRRPSYSLTTLFPIYWAGRDPKEGSGWKLLVPLYLSSYKEEGRQFSWFTPAAAYSRNDGEGARTFGSWIVPMLYRRDPQRELDMALLLYWRHKNLRNDASTLLVGPFYRGTDPEGSTTTLFPLFWHFRDAATGASAHSLFPLYFRRSSPSETLTAGGVFPLWAYYRSFRGDDGGDGGGFSTGLFPLAFFGSRPERGHGVLFPLFWHFRDRKSTATVAAPFFYRFASDASTTAGVPPLLYFYGRAQHTVGDRTVEDRTHVQFPLFWRFANGRTGNTTTVIPPFYWKSGATGWSAGLFPLVFAGNWATRGHFVLAPLVWRFRDDEADKTTTLVANYLYRRHGNERTDAFLPFFYWRRGAKPGGSEETSFTLAPFVHYTRKPDQRVIATPLGFSARGPERKAGFIPPYFWYESKNLAVRGVPALYLDLYRKASYERTRIWGPFVATDSPGASSRVLFPLVARYHDEKEAGTWVFPSFVRRRLHDGYALDTLLPVFWYSRSPSHSTTVVGPFYRSSGQVPGATDTGNRFATGLLPLFMYAKNSERRYLLTPLFYDRANYREGTGRTIALPLFFRSYSPEGHTTVGFPLYWGGRTGPRSHAVLFPLLWHFADDSDQSRLTLLGPLYWSTRGQPGKQERVRGLLPLAWYSRNEEHGTASHALLPLFYEKHGRAERKILTLPFGYGANPQRSFWYALNLVRYQSTTSTFTTLFPLFLNHANHAQQSSTTLIPPLLYFSRSRPDRSLTGLGLLLWRHTNVSSATTLVLPLFYDVHNYHENRLTMLVPLLLRYWRASDQNTYTVAPLFYRRSAPADSTTVAFPLYWDFNSPESRTTVLFPLFASFRRPAYTSRFIFPNIYYRKGHGAQEGTSRLFIPPLWESASRRRGDTMWEILLGLFGYERIGRNRYMKLFFIPFELEPAPAAQTAWYGRTRRSPTARPERRYGLDTRAW